MSKEFQKLQSILYEEILKLDKKNEIRRVTDQSKLKVPQVNIQE